MNQIDYTIKYDKLNEVFTCNIEENIISSETLIDIIKYIGVLFGYEVWHIVNLDSYVEDLERFAKISITYDF